MIGDWPCRAGRLWFTPAGVVTRCTLAVGHRLASFDLPAGAECFHNPATGGWELQLTQDGPALRIAALNADLPPGGLLVLTANGALRRLYVPHEVRMAIAGVAPHGHIILDGSRLTAELAEPTQVDGVMLPAEKVVRLDLSTGKVEATTRSLVIEPRVAATWQKNETNSRPLSVARARNDRSAYRAEISSNRSTKT